MRPVRLEMEGFAAFRERTVVDFDDAELFALVGPTGSGKSSVIDAICFALYGSVPRYGDRRKVGDAVSIGALECRVSLTFEAGGRRCIATRVVRRDKKGGATTKEARLELDGGEVLAGAEREMSRVVEHEVLGLSFDHFTRAVVLPQGEFARFLHDGPKERQALLVELLGLGDYQEMMRAANALAARHEAEIALAQQRLADLADATPEQHAIWAEWVVEYAKLREELRDARAELDQLGTTLREAEAEAARGAALLEHLDAVVVPAEVEALDAERARVTERVEAAHAAAQAAEKERTAATEALTELGDRDVLVAARDTHAQLARLQARCTELEDALAAADAAADAAHQERGEAEAASTRAAAELAALERAHAAHQLGAALTPGAPCPVCDQIVTVVPRRRRPGALDAAERACTTAAKRHDRARKAAELADQDLAARRAKRSELADRMGELEAGVRGHSDGATVVAHLAEHDAAREAREAAVEAERLAQRALRDAQEQRRTLEHRFPEAVARFGSQRDPIVGTGAEPPAPTGDLLTDWRALAEWAAGAREAQERELHAAEATVERARSARDARLDGLRARAEELELTPRTGAPIDELVELAAEAETKARNEVSRIAKEMDEAASLEVRVVAQRAEQETARMLAGLLRADKLERWLLDEAFVRLAAGASERLWELSSGQYSLRFDEGGREFLVVDHRNADETRSVKTLSGGETFQASLALALTLADELAEMATGHAARLESIFLDEGFGTLDPDTLDTVASTIEALGVGPRMVGLVTHVRELAERVPVRYRVAKEGRTSVVAREVA